MNNVPTFTLAPYPRRRYYGYMNTDENSVYIDFSTDHGIAYDAAGAMDKLGLNYRLTASNKLVLNESAVESLRSQPVDANGGISDDEDGVPCMWMYGYAYPVLAATGPVT